MAATGILFWDGFDFYADGVPPMNRWTSLPNLVSASYAVNSFGKGARMFGEGTRYFGSTYDDVCLQYRAILNGGTSLISRFRDAGGAADQLRLEITSDRALRAMRGSTELGRSAAFKLLAGGKYMLEQRVKFDNSAGLVQVRANGELILNLSSVDTQNAAGDDCGGFHVCGADGGGDGIYVDDVIFRDWSVLNDWIGDRYVKGNGLANADGDHTDFTASAGSDFQCVDDQDGDTTHIESATVGHKTSVTYPGHGITAGSVLAVAITSAARKTDGAVRQYRNFCKHSTSTSNGATKTQGAAFEYLTDLFEDVPGGSNWTLSQADAAQGGVEVIA